MKLQSIEKANVTIEDGALILTIAATDMDTVFGIDGNKIQVPGKTEELPFVFHASDRNGLSPQVGKYLLEHKSAFDPEVRGWIEANLVPGSLHDTRNSGNGSPAAPSQRNAC